MTRQKMIDFLKNHFRYSTMNSWNNSTSYAADVKISHGDWVPHKLINKAYEMLDMRQVFDLIEDRLREFAEDHDYRYQISFNGRSSGYLVMVEGTRKPTEHKSRCRECRQLNFEAIEQGADVGKCGACGQMERVNLEGPIYQVSTFPGRNIDMGETFSEWETYEIEQRVKLVREFDQAVEDCKKIFLDACKRYKVVEEEILVPKKVKVLREVKTR